MIDPVDADVSRLIGRTGGVLIGVLVSLAIIAPKGTRNLVYRLAIGLVGGWVYAPAFKFVPWTPWLHGDHWEPVLMRGMASGLVTFFILEFIVRMVASRDTLQRLAREMLRLSGDGKGSGGEGGTND